MALLLSPGAGAQGAGSKEQARSLLAPHGIERFQPLLVRALETWIDVEERYWNGDYKACKKQLDRLWRDFPPGHKAWGRSRSRVREVFLGRYPCYYALRMLTTCVDWRLESSRRLPKPHRAVLAIALVGKSRGTEPRNLDELVKGEGIEVEHELHESLLADDHRIVRQSLRLFREYVLAITEGRLAVDLEFVSLPDLVVEVATRAKPRRHAGIVPGGMKAVWSAIDEEVCTRVDWWWVLYPSHVPERYEDFAKTEFITGGMGTGPDGSQPCFISNDLWLVRKPPHLGKGEYTDIERRAYLPHWLQHEFFHHLYRTWPTFGLEKKGHQWFDRSTWPKDFVGTYEPDYYHESVIKRLQTSATPPLHIGLRYDRPDAATLAKIEISSIVGSYEHRPVQNRWHRGRITRTKDAQGQTVLLWRNDAGKSWKLHPELGRGMLRTGKANPYYESNPTHGRHFRLVLKRDASGDYVPTIEGFTFQGALYRRKTR